MKYTRALAAATVALLATAAQAIILDVPSGGQLCVDESVRNGNPLTLEYKVYQVSNNWYTPLAHEDPLRMLKVTITDSKNTQLYTGTQITGRFSYTPTYDGTVKICMTDTAHGLRTPSTTQARAVDIKHIHGTTTSQYSEMARKEKLQVCHSNHRQQ